MSKKNKEKTLSGLLGCVLRRESKQRKKINRGKGNYMIKEQNLKCMTFKETTASFQSRVSELWCHVNG
jgi:hypothetical protein